MDAIPSTKTSFARFVSSLTAFCLLAGATRADTSTAVIASEELAVVQAMAAIANREANSSFDFLYFESDFTASRHVASSMANPDRTAYCGLTRDQGLALVQELKALNASPVHFDKDVAKLAGLKLGQKKLERFRYLMVSRVVFDPSKQHAWLAVDLNGETGAVMRLDKVGAEWNKSARCAGWVRTEAS